MARGDRRLRTADGAYNQVGQRVREQRNVLKMTQDALCARLALASEGAWNPDRRDIYKIEHCTRTVTDVEILALAKALDCDPVWIFIGLTNTASKSEQTDKKHFE